MTRAIYRYEVELRAFNQDGTSVTKIFVQDAYTVGDAVSQSLYLLPQDNLKRVEIVRVGPPLEDIRQQADELLREVDRRMRHLRQTPLDAMGVQLSSGRGKATT